MSIQYHKPAYFYARYERLHSLLKNGRGHNADKVILFKPNEWGGFGNSFSGLYSSALFALVHGLQLRGIICRLLYCNK